MLTNASHHDGDFENHFLAKGIAKQVPTISKYHSRRPK